MDECTAFVWVKNVNKCYGKNTKVVDTNTPKNPEADLYAKETGFINSLAQNWGSIALAVAGLFVVVVISKFVYLRRKSGGSSSYGSKDAFIADFQNTVHDLEQGIENSRTNEFERYDQFLERLKGDGS